MKDLYGNSWTAARSSQSITPLLLWNMEKVAYLCVLPHTSKRNLAFIQNEFIVVSANQKAKKNLTNKASPKPCDWFISMLHSATLKQEKDAGILQGSECKYLANDT